mmetsp:Transcript_31329/g.63561  ORF Transcript_31329/g.63561 Transcript_31329/m.63561 type:complete len:420 (-) Transcript_31329:179-1438(-)
MHKHIYAIVALVACVVDSISITEGLARYQAWFNIGINNRLATYTVTEDDVTVERKQRLSHFAGLAFPETLQTTNSANVACSKKQLLVDGRKASGGEFVSPGMVLSLLLPSDRRVTIPDDEERAIRWCRKRVNLLKVLSDVNQSPPLSILYEDDAMAIVCKPSGIHSMSWKDTMGQGILCLDEVLPLILTPPKESLDPLTAPLPRHRLDARVAGPIVVAKTKRALVQLGKSFEFGTAIKQYRAILVSEGKEVLRDLPELTAVDSQSKLVVNREIDGRESITEVSVLARTPCNIDGMCIDVALYPKTGRKHQLRRHCAEVLGAPILGDDLHTGKRDEADSVTLTAVQNENGESDDDDEITVRRRIGLFLYCRSISIPHPVDDEEGRMVSVEIPEPRRFATHRDKARKGWEWQQENGDSNKS